MGDKIFGEMRNLLQEAKGKKVISEAATPVSARNMKELAERVVKSWNRAYGEFVGAREAAYDIAATFNLSTRVAGGAKEVKNITRDSDDSLARTIAWVADRFRKDYQNDVVKKGGDLREDAKRLQEAADKAEDFEDKDLHEAAVKFMKEFLPFRTGVSDHLYRSVGAIARRSEELINRYMPPEARPSKPPGGSRGPRYKGAAIRTPEGVGKRAADVIEHLDTFVRLSEPTNDEIEKISSLAEEVAKDLPPEGPPPEGEEPTTTPTEGQRRKRITDWLELRWEADPEIGTFL